MHVGYSVQAAHTTSSPSARGARLAFENTLVYHADDITVARVAVDVRYALYVPGPGPSLIRVCGRPTLGGRPLRGRPVPEIFMGAAKALVGALAHESGMLRLVDAPCGPIDDGNEQ